MSQSQHSAVVTEADDNALRDPATATNVLIVGVGGQGVIMVSKVIALLCQQHQLQVKQSEVHGMAKRGGVVFSHVRFGQQVYSPTIPTGEADVILALEWAEGLRWLKYLNPQTGTFIADTQQIVPPFSCRNRHPGGLSGYDQLTVNEIRSQLPGTLALDAGGIAGELGNAKAANTVLLGALSTALDFPAEDWQKLIASAVPPKTVEVNRQAFTTGREWALNPPAVSAAELVAPVALEPVQTIAELEITDAWCKGCDICVKVCPERCLFLNEQEVVEISDPAACTGCRLCEWLCPDFAIRIHIQAVESQA
ncbi:MAG: pyruvate ferredoxin oxidoreductase [Proteobacteria bacterium]|jgi:indolepyruvate ferredoxin oxidoreductase beta subunit|nr:pyruvate ferredoxin oxidoreductase [Pseudomonadota bacterium]HJP06839.1 2-oxoacid:acceptor oxidoreductase family protein [Arenicellales bacterium]|tara:strand:- start:4806 stop:5732 length:927 start_codon:yes stop_codon:yes gene_type:complete